MEGSRLSPSPRLVGSLVVKVKADGRASTGREVTWGRWTVDHGPEAPKVLW